MDNDRNEFEQVARALQGDMALLGAIGVNDGAVRAEYARRIEALVAELRRDAETGRTTWGKAAEEAARVRNTTMEVMRGRTSPVGRAIAEELKQEGKTLNELIGRYAVRRFGANTDFTRLRLADQELVYADVVAAAARANPRVTVATRVMSRAGRGLLVFSLAVSVYEVYTAEDKVRAAEREAAITGGSILGGMAAGAVGGLACGPGAPVCVGLFAFAGGAAVALGIDWAW